MDRQSAVALSAPVEAASSVLSTSIVRFFFHSIVFDFVLTLSLMSVHPSVFKKEALICFRLCISTPGGFHECTSSTTGQISI